MNNQEKANAWFKLADSWTAAANTAERSYSAWFWISVFYCLIGVVGAIEANLVFLLFIIIGVLGFRLRLSYERLAIDQHKLSERCRNLALDYEADL